MIFKTALTSEEPPPAKARKPHARATWQPASQTTASSLQKTVFRVMSNAEVNRLLPSFAKNHGRLSLLFSLAHVCCGHLYLCGF